VIFGGSVPDGKLDGIYAEMIQIAESRGVRSILDSRGQALRAGIEAAPFMVKPNLRETEDLLGTPLPDEQSRWQAIDWYESKGTEVVVMSMGAEGALASLAGARWRAIPPRVEQVNPVGSGDCLVAGMAAGIRRRWPLEEALRLGVACGAANAAVWEAAHVAPEQVQELVTRVILEPVSHHQTPLEDGS
jgi:tagatose 6-phosphate kinase